MKTFTAKDRSEWRTWLCRNAGACAEIWLVYYNKTSGKPSIAYEESVEEALCFGWVDGKIKKLDASRCARRFTPRKPRSSWSALNIQRAGRMIAQGKMTAAGLKAFSPQNRKDTPAMPSTLPPELVKQFRTQSGAWVNFQNFSPYYRRMTAGWVASAKKPETREKRLKQLIAFSARNKRLEFM